ncbi:MAG: outer membrane protein assembly factor [Dysgonamonadaceae bacterium]|jgi:hypothetical protein|nr:outer membrane protein assembly factor [Dysgonamonadaceae bacterium]
MKTKFLYHITLLLILLGCASCHTTKFVPEGEYLLDKVKIESDVPDYRTYDLKLYVRQLPNYKMLGIGKFMLGMYNLAGHDSTKWINRFLRKMGEEPVIFDSTLVFKTDREFNKLLINKGYINAAVTSEITRKNNKKANVVYRIRGNMPYRIRQYDAEIEDDSIAQIFEQDKILEAKSLVKEGMLFDRNQLDAERIRIAASLRDHGYYAFKKDYISYEADTALNAAAVDLTLKLHSSQTLLPSGNYAEVLHKKYYYDKIQIYLDYDPLKRTGIANYPKKDSISINGYTIFYQGNKPSLRTRTLLDKCFIQPQKEYSQTREEATYSAFSALTALSSAHLQFNEKQRNDSSLLDCFILATPARKQSISYSIEGTNTTGDIGAAMSLNYVHKNLFRGSESFYLRLRGASEAITRNTIYSEYSSSESLLGNVEWGVEAAIRIPKFILPRISISDDWKLRMQTYTEFALSYNDQKRIEFDRRLLSGGIRYNWQKRDRLSTLHRLNLLNIDYIYLPRIDSLFYNYLPRNAKSFGYTNQFIVGTSYSFTHTTFDPMQKQRNAHSLRFSVESAGNLLYAASSLLKWKKDDEGYYQLFNTYYAQFVKGDFDYSKTIVIDKQNSLAWRVGGGIGYPYGNSKVLPFEKRYYSGGANSVRAWSVRELGPGSYVPNAESTFAHQAGDIKLDLNFEYRSRFFWKLEAAAFIDAGNVWTIKNYEEQPGGQFKLDTFYKQIAIGYGLGLRLDFDFFLVRLDCGWKAYDPAKQGADAWAILHPNFKNNWAWHIAIGYPF